MSTRVVIPPAAAAWVAVAKPSQSVFPGSHTWTCESTIPGRTTTSASNSTSRGARSFASTGATEATRPSRMAIEWAASPSPPMTRAARITTSKVCVTHSSGGIDCWHAFDRRVAEKFLDTGASRDDGHKHQVDDGSGYPRLESREADVGRAEAGDAGNHAGRIGADTGSKHERHDRGPVSQRHLAPGRHAMERAAQPEEPREDEHIHRHDGARHGHGDGADRRHVRECLRQAGQDKGQGRGDEAEPNDRELAPPPRNAREQVLGSVDGDVEVSILNRPLVDEKDDHHQARQSKDREVGEIPNAG